MNKQHKEIIVYRDKEVIYSVPIPSDISKINTLVEELIKQFTDEYTFNEIEVKLETSQFFGW